MRQKASRLLIEICMVVSSHSVTSTASAINFFFFYISCFDLRFLKVQLCQLFRCSIIIGNLCASALRPLSLLSAWNVPKQAMACTLLLG
jgi:hypothetical protein